jgi:hypothetical protein
MTDFGAASAQSQLDAQIGLHASSATVQSQQLLDRVQSLTHIAELEADPRAYADRLANELAAAASRDELAARDDRLRDALARIDAMAERAMRIRLDHVLAGDTAIGMPTRKVFATTVLGYESKLDVLEARARDVAHRGGSLDPARIASSVVDAASATLALRSTIRRGVLALISELATASVAPADRDARDRRIDDPTRRAWSALRRELEAVAAQPERVAEAAMAARLATWPEQLDEPDPSSEPTFADMIEID